MKRGLVVIGGGPAGLAAAYQASLNGVKDILIIERDNALGGILNQCIHNGFGLHQFKEELTGPEYASRFIEMVKTTNVEVKSDTMVIHLTDKKEIHYVNSKEGYKIIEAEAIVLAMGCRERTRGAISIPGDRCSGIYTAGAAQKYLNMDGYLVGKRVVILGSGDIGLIMARRMTLEGAKVLAVVELMPYSNGLTRNIVQCLEDFNIPLYLSHTVTNLIGKDRLSKVIVSEVDENKVPIKGTEMEFDCDSLLLSVGLLPENELSREAGIKIDRRTNGPIVYENMETSIEGVFACGNVLHVHDLVDYVSKEASRAGDSASKYLKNGSLDTNDIIDVIPADGINYTVPQHIRRNNTKGGVDIFFRVRNQGKNKLILVKDNGNIIYKIKKQHLAPAEMEFIHLSENILKAASGKITVEVGE